MRHRSMIAMLLCVAAAAILAVASPAGAQPEPIRIHVAQSYYMWPEMPAPPGPLVTDPASPVYIGTSITTADPVDLFFGVSTYGRGRAQTARNWFDVSLTVTGPDGFMVSIGGKAANPYWSPVYSITDPEFLASVQPFNPRIGAELYASDWVVPLTGLAPGIYSVHSVTWVKHTTTDLFLYFDDQHKPYMFRPPGEDGFIRWDASWRFEVIQ